MEQAALLFDAHRSVFPYDYFRTDILLYWAPHRAHLRAGPLGGAALDVTDPEQLPPTHPLYALITPHMASASHAARGAMAIRAAQNLLAGLNGEPLVSAINPEALGHGRSKRRARG